jgi:glycosyltransferase involved in cell wall biosynthesis
MTHVLNIMLGRQQGRLEEAAIAYAMAMRQAGITCTTITATKAWANDRLDALELPRISFSNLGSFDPLAALKLWHLAHHTDADLLLCHGNRALRLALWGLKHRIRLIAVAQNFRLKHVLKADAAFCATKAIMLEAELQGMDKTQLTHMPHMVHMPDHLQAHTMHQRPPVIGCIGHLTRENGLDNLLEAASIMNQRGLHYEILIAGDGEELPRLEALVEERHLSRTVRFAGFVENSAEFFSQIDLFVQPAHHKLVGSMMMQAMAYGLSCVSTHTQGPGEFAHHGIDALLVERNNPEALALAIERVLTDGNLAADIAGAGQLLMARHYSMDAFAMRLQDAIEDLPVETFVMDV